jgi:pyruvate/2-oxoglutarate dehydrogenase complex dihydrolipoamide dehydrogenase (E3) component
VADVLSEVREAGEFGVQVAEPTVDYAAVMARREKVITTLTAGVAGLFKKNMVEFARPRRGWPGPAKSRSATRCSRPST